MRFLPQTPLSLRWRLLLPLVSAAIVISLLFLLVMRQITEQAVQATQDALLKTAVSSILEHTRSTDYNVEIDLPYDVFTMLGAISEDKIYYRIDLDGDLLTGYEELELASTAPVGLDPVLSSTVIRGVNKHRQCLPRQHS